ncbi:hypothetical protein ACFL36_05285, partial [Thermodesulfobacteriota bacterium]
IMKKELFTLLIILIIGCVSQPEIRYYKSYNRSPEFKSFIQGDSYKLWYDERIHSQFIEFEKDSAEWKAFQKKWGTFSLDHYFYNRISGIFFIIAKNRYKQSYDKMLKRFKKNIRSINLTIIESDQRMVNNAPVLYIRFFGKEDGTNMMLSAYFINYDSGMLLIMIAGPEDEYGEHRKEIEEAMNGIELN